MIRCPLNSFKECIREECPFYNVRKGCCILPRYILNQMKHDLKEENYESDNQYHRG